MSLEEFKRAKHIGKVSYDVLVKADVTDAITYKP